MDFDIFLSISQVPIEGIIPDESTMFNNFFEQLESADSLGLELLGLHKLIFLQKFRRKIRIL